MISNLQGVAKVSIIQHITQVRKSLIPSSMYTNQPKKPKWYQIFKL